MTKKPYLIKSQVGGVKCKFLFAFFAVLLILMGNSQAYADEEPKSVTQDGLVYTVLDDGESASVKASSTEISGEIEILNEVTIDGNKYPVTEIADKGFESCEQITNVAIPLTVTSIGKSAFRWCSKLKSVNIPEGVTTIDEYTFWSCVSLTGITLPSTITKIGSLAFGMCESLGSINIPKGLTDLASGAFGGCTSLTKIDIDLGNPKYTIEDGFLIDNDNNKKTTLAYIGGESVVKIPDDVTAIGEGSFRACNAFSIIIPNGVASIGYEAFSSCNNLISIAIPKSVTQIDGYAFEYCRKLSSITIPSSVISLRGNTFYYAKGLEYIYLENGDLTLEGEPYGCTAEVIYPTATVRKYDFTVILPDGVTATGNNIAGSFGNRVYVKSGASITLSDLEDGSSYVVIPDDKCTVNGKTITDITGDIVVANPPDFGFNIMNGTTYAEVMAGNTDLEGEITIPSTTTVDGVDYTVVAIVNLSNCDKITTLNIPSSVMAIYAEAFKGCTNLTKIVIDNYEGSVMIEGELPSGVAVEYLRQPTDFVFKDLGDGTVEVLSGRKDLSGAIVIPATDPDGHKVVAIADEAFSSEMVITSSIDALPMITSVVIPEGVTRIGVGAFSECQSLSYVKIPSTVEEIGMGAFAGCMDLNLDIAEKSPFSFSNGFLFKTTTENGKTKTTLVEYIGHKSVNVTIPDGCDEIAPGAFVYCPLMESLFIPETVSKVGESPFALCLSLAFIYVDKSEGELDIDLTNIVPSSLPLTPQEIAVYYLKDKTIPDNTFCVTVPEGCYNDKGDGETVIINTSVKATRGSKIYVINTGDASITLADLDEGCEYIASDLNKCSINGNEISDITGDVTISLKTPLFSFKVLDEGAQIATVAEYGKWVTSSVAELPDVVLPVGDQAVPVGGQVVPGSSVPAGLERFRIFGAIEIPANATIDGKVYDVITIAEGAFSSQSITSVTIPEGVLAIGVSAFEEDYLLTSVTLPTTLEYIGFEAFAKTAISTITIPKKVTTVEENAFAGCSNLKTIYVQQSATINGKPNTLLANAGVPTDCEVIFLGSEEQLVYDITDENDKHTLIFNGDYEGKKVLDLDMNINPSIKELQFTRTFTPGVYSTIILPFKIAHPENCGEFYTFKGVNYDKTLGQWVANVYPVEPENVSFNTPYIFKSYSAMPEFTKDVTEISTYPGAETLGGNASYFTEEGNWAFCGMYNYLTFTDDVKNVYGFAGAPDNDVKIGDFVQAAPGAYVNPFRCVLYHNGEGLAKSNPVLPESIVVRVVHPSETTEPAEIIEQPETGEITTPVAEAAPADNIRVWSSNRTIFIESPADTEYRIIDLGGRVVKTGTTRTTRDEITLPRTTGVLLVVINGKTFKILY